MRSARPTSPQSGPCSPWPAVRCCSSSSRRSPRPMAGRGALRPRTLDARRVRRGGGAGTGAALGPLRGVDPRMAADAVRRVAAARLSGRRPPAAAARGRYNVYTLLLDYADRTGGPHGVYVGMSHYPPAQLFDQHKAGIRAAGNVLKRGLEVLTGPVLHLPDRARRRAAHRGVAGGGAGRGGLDRRRRPLRQEWGACASRRRLAICGSGHQRDRHRAPQGQQQRRSCANAMKRQRTRLAPSWIAECAGGAAT